MAVNAKREQNRSLFPNLGVGLGLRAPHYRDIVGSQPDVGFFEAISENFIGLGPELNGGRPLRWLEDVRSSYPVVLHGVSLSIGSTDELDRSYLQRLKDLYARIEPQWVSDHVCWTGHGGVNAHDLLPLPYTEETLEHLVERVSRVQEFLGRRLLLENVSSYVSFKHSEMTEWEFLSELSRRADCGLLLDVNNVFVSSVNHGFDPLAYLRGLPRERVGQIHLAGHTRSGELLIDTHDQPVCDEVWDLYRDSLKIFGSVSAMIERDGNIPSFDDLWSEAKVIHAIQDAHEEETSNGQRDATRIERIQATLA